MTPVSGCPSSSVGLIPQASSKALLARAARIGLQWRYWSLMNSSVRPSARSAVDRLRRRPGRTNASNSTDGAASRLTSTSIASPDGRLHRSQRRRHESRHGALAPSADRRAATSASPSHPSATRIATRRVRMLPSPGRANSDSAGDAVDLRRHVACRAPSASAPASRGCRGPSATRFGEFRVDVHQARHHPLADRRRLHPRQLEAERVDDVRASRRRVWLFQNSVACV